MGFVAWWALSSAWAGEGTWLVSVTDRAAVEARVAAAGGAARCWDAARLCVVDGVPEAVVRGPGAARIERDRPFTAVPPKEVHRRSDADGTPECRDLWELDAVAAPAAWSVTDGAGELVAIADSGFRRSHDDLVGTDGASVDYGDSDDNPEVTMNVAAPGHGTFIAGIIAGAPDNGFGRIGLAPGADLGYLKIADAAGNLYFSYAILALQAIADGDVPARVLNYSLAGPSSTEAFDDAVSALEAADVVVVTAAANCYEADCAEADNDVTPMWPSNHPGAHVLTVAGTLDDDTLNPFSHYGATTVDLAAPGAELCSLGVGSDDDIVVADGTSYATAIVAGAAALVRAAHPDATAAEVVRVIDASVDAVPALAGKVASGGRLNAGRAVAAPIPRLSVPATLTVDGVGALAVAVDNVGGAGELVVTIEHDGALSFEAPDGFAAAEEDAADGRRRTTLSGPLAAGANTLDVGIVAARDVEDALYVHVVAAADGAELASPVDGDVDGAGAPALVVAVTATGGGGCGCDGAGGSGWIAALGAVVALRRRASVTRVR